MKTSTCVSRLTVLAISPSCCVFQDGRKEQRSSLSRESVRRREQGRFIGWNGNGADGKMLRSICLWQSGHRHAITTVSLLNVGHWSMPSKSRKTGGRSEASSPMPIGKFTRKAPGIMRLSLIEHIQSRPVSLRHVLSVGLLSRQKVRQSAYKCKGGACQPGPWSIMRQANSQKARQAQANRSKHQREFPLAV